ncbi:uncharacterized protein isoform X1 [Leptinotarsa decemlineata]|uniref:uncharacterized protein isoform X1 n=1 Tax=Leptinotarsa decemlineata TaxID=7539 RepID=UPI003D309E95
MTSSNSNTFNVSQKLDVSQITLSEIPDSIVFPNELNDFLREQIRYQVHENGMLQKKISDLETDYEESQAKISELITKLGNYEKLCNKNEFITSNQVASMKIVELSKKLREKNSEVEALKTKYSKLEKHLFDMKQAFVENNKDSKKLAVEEKPVNELEEELKKLTDKLSCVNAKLADSKNNNLQLKNELKLANKWLQQEIGESFESLQLMNNSNNGWRGRSQVICDLTQKNNELREKLKSLQEKVKVPVSEPNLSINKFESKVSILSMENTDLKGKYDDLKKKYEALRARCKVLDAEYSMLKSKTSMMKEQSDRDQDLISTLTLQISSSKNSMNETFHQKEWAIGKLNKEKKQLLSEIEEYKNVIKNLQEELSKKVERKNEVNLTEFEQKKTSEKSDISEPGTLGLLDLIEQQNNRLKIEREEHAKTQAILRVEKQRAAKAEAAAARLELESNTCRSGYSSNVSCTKPRDGSLRDQLELAEENIKALKTRLDLEQFERKNDLQEFSKIIKVYTDNKD